MFPAYLTACARETTSGQAGQSQEVLEIPEDVTERALWNSYLTAYNDALTACRGPDARWWIIPSDRKWYRNWAVAALLTQRLQDLDPRYPPPPKNIHRERKRIIATRADIRGTTAVRRSG